MGFKLEYSFSNQCYNDIVKFVIDLIPAKHNMSKDLYQSKKIVVGLRMDNEKIDVCKRNYMLFWKEHKDGSKCMHYGRFSHTRFLCQNQVLIVCMPKINCSTHIDQKCSQITKCHE
jgi:hypothetical protein